MIGLSSNLFAQTRIQMTLENGVYMLPCEVNGLRMSFVFDTGASDVSISLSEAIFMLRHDYLDEKDVLGSSYYQIANGDIIEGTKIILRKIKVGDKYISNVTASIVHNIDAPLLLGQSALSKLGMFAFDYDNNQLILYSSDEDINHNIVSESRRSREDNSIYTANKSQSSSSPKHGIEANPKLSYQSLLSPVRTTINNKCQLWEGPTSVNSLGSLNSGVVVKVLGSENRYWKIQVGNRVGYVSDFNINVVSGMEGFSTIQSPSVTNDYQSSSRSSSTADSKNTSSHKSIVIPSNIYARTRIKNSCRVYRSPKPLMVAYRLEKDDWIQLLGYENGYWKINVNQQTGYINKNDLVYTDYMRDILRE